MRSCSLLLSAVFFCKNTLLKSIAVFFVKEVTVEKTVPIFVEKEIPMIAVDRSEAHVLSVGR